MIRHYSRLAACCLLGGLLFASHAAYAGTVSYTIDVPTATLTTNLASGPFSLDFQFFDGSGTGNGNNQVTLSNFQFGGGSLIGTPNLTGGGSGDLLSTVSLSDAGNVFSDVQQQFIPGSDVQFTLTTTTNVEPGGTPDEFSFFLLDGTYSPITTTDSVTQRDALGVIDLDSSSPELQLYDGTGAYAGVTPSVPIVAPESGSAVFLALGLLAGSIAGGWLIRARRVRRVG